MKLEKNKRFNSGFTKTSQDIWETENKKPKKDLAKLKSDYMRKMGT